MPTVATAGNAPPSDENMVSEQMDEELLGGDSPVTNSISMAALMGGYNAVDAAKVQALASDCDDGDKVFMNISPTQFKTIVEELSMIYIGAAQACDAQAIMRAQMNKRVRAVTTTEWQRASEVSLMMSSSEDHETTINPSLSSPVKDKDLTTTSPKFKTPRAKFTMWFKQHGKGSRWVEHVGDLIAFCKVHCCADLLNNTETRVEALSWFEGVMYESLDGCPNRFEYRKPFVDGDTARPATGYEIFKRIKSRWTDPFIIQNLVRDAARELPKLRIRPNERVADLGAQMEHWVSTIATNGDPLGNPGRNQMKEHLFDAISRKTFTNIIEDYEGFSAKQKASELNPVLIRLTAIEGTIAMREGVASVHQVHTLRGFTAESVSGESHTPVVSCGTQPVQDVNQVGGMPQTVPHGAANNGARAAAVRTLLREGGGAVGGVLSRGTTRLENDSYKAYVALAGRAFQTAVKSVHETASTSWKGQSISMGTYAITPDKLDKLSKKGTCQDHKDGGRGRGRTTLRVEVVEEENDDEMPVDYGVEYDFDGVHDESEPIHRVWAEVRAVPATLIVTPLRYHDSGYSNHTCGDGPDDDVGDDEVEPPAGRVVSLELADLLSDDSDGSSDEDDDDVPELVDDSSSDKDCEVDGQVHACARACTPNSSHEPSGFIERAALRESRGNSPQCCRMGTIITSGSYAPGKESSLHRSAGRVSAWRHLRTGFTDTRGRSLLPGAMLRGRSPLCIGPPGVCQRGATCGPGTRTPE